MLVRKSLKLDEVKLKVDGDAGTFEGYASRFGGIDTYGDTIMAGAFKSTLRQNGMPKMFFNHEWDMPIGRYLKCAEDESGLYVKGSFTPNLGLAGDVRAAMLHETLDGLSVGGFVSKGDREDKADESGQIIHKFTRLVEISPCVFPADAGARVDLATVRGEDVNDVVEELSTVRDCERLLRDAGGFSKAQATAIAARFAVIFGGEKPTTKTSQAETGALVARLERLGSRLAA